ncbi:conjugative transposon TraK protein [Pedobacter sp. W3I1]|uniref:conjugative transposon protein TraK n=1 Tax=Pedobacter sp. W3I1 TaxID=3042291 RepID=UPI0027859108|nr:conjugative transposon protein TraK [Pedobacter sp. W3I1]MDQ0640152.1 conjugative transposon TraK protein [Pedobacter sp. W3I1]
MIIKNIESKIRLATLVSMGSLVCASLISISTGFFAYKQIEIARKSIYIFENNVPVMARQTDEQLIRPAVYRGHVELFHSLFFSLTPDDRYIDYQMKKAMYLIDESGMQQYLNLKEKGYFSSILSSSSVLTLQTDSIYIDVKKKYFRYYGKQRIERRSSIVTRSMITEGYLRDIPKSDNNLYGVLILSWKTIENKDIENVQKNPI